MSADDPLEPGRSLATVGYRSPPVEHRFRKGVSGNPRGRPPKAAGERQRTAKQLYVEDILMTEALRPIQVRENDQIVEMPMIQAVIRGMGVAAVKGSHRAQMALTQMATAAQNKHLAAHQEFFETFHIYKTRWLAELERCDRAGVARPAPIPHPDDIVLNYKRGTVTFNGPISHDDKAQWDGMLEIRKGNLEDIEEGERFLRNRPGKMRAFAEADIAESKKMADIIGGIIPDEETRREPGFDLQTWRDQNGTLERITLEKKARDRKRGARVGARRR